MIVKKVNFVNFRSHRSFCIEFKKKTTMITGENGCGKTSVLEGIFEALRGKSFKAVDKEVVRRGEDFYRIDVELYNNERVRVYYDVRANKKTFQVEDKRTARLPKKCRYPIVLFEPNDLNLIGASPTSKRGYFDEFFGQLSDSYSNSLSRYNKVLKQRNELLKEEFLREDALFSWNVMLAKYGTEITQKRKNFVDKINHNLTQTYRMIAENDDIVELAYETQVDGGEGAYLNVLQGDFQKDHILGHTSFGVHRDDFVFLFNGQKADGTASRGEVRSVVLALKFIEAEMLKLELGKKPLILLDDVFSELDETRQKCLARNFKNNQVIITSVEQLD